MKRHFFPIVLLLTFSACTSDGPDGSDGIDQNDSTENALQHVGGRIEDGLKTAVDSGVPKLGRAVERADKFLERADTTIRKVGDRVERAGDRIGRRFEEGRERGDTVR